MADTASTLINKNEDKNNVTAGDSHDFQKVLLNEQIIDEKTPSKSSDFDEVSQDDQINDETPLMTTTPSNSSSLRIEKTEVANKPGINWTGITKLNIVALLLLLGSWLLLLMLGGEGTVFTKWNVLATVTVILISVLNILAVNMEEAARQQQKDKADGPKGAKQSNVELESSPNAERLSEDTRMRIAKMFPAYMVSINYVLWATMWMYIIAAEYHPCLLPNQCANKFILFLGGLTLTMNLR